MTQDFQSFAVQCLISTPSFTHEEPASQGPVNGRETSRLFFGHSKYNEIRGFTPYLNHFSLLAQRKVIKRKGPGNDPSAKAGRADNYWVFLSHIAYPPA